MSQRYIQLSLMISTAFIATILLSHLHIEYLWFTQFHLESVLIKKLYLKSLLLLLATTLSALLIMWQKRWKHIMQKKSNKENKKKLTGLKYGLSVLSTILILSLTISLLMLITYSSLIQPFNSLHWWTLIYGPNSGRILITVLATIISILVIFKKVGITLIQIIGFLLFTIIVTRSWGIWSLALSISPTGIKEPLYGSDITFGLGIYPALLFIFTLLLIITTQTMCSSFWIYLTVNRGLSDWSVPYLDIESKNHLRPISFVMLISITCIAWLSRHQFLWTQNGIVPGAGWLDIHFNIPLRTFLCILLIIFALQILPITHPWKKLVRYTTAVLFTLTILIEFTLTPFLEWIIVKPRELKLESPYLTRAIRSTRRAFQLDSIKTKLINPKSQLTNRDLILGESTLKNIRLWDSQPLLDTNRQLQQLRQYYRFTNVAVDRYRLKANSDERQQVMITARELDQEQLPDSSRTWLNKHFVFTHGYGFTVSPINTKAQDGLPEYFVSDLGKSAKIQGSSFLDISDEDVKSSLPIGNASIYYGMLPSSYVIAPSNIKELDYPQGDKNIFNHYKGNGGIKLNNALNKISAAIYLKEPRLLNTGALTNHSHLLLKREVRQRMRALVPFIDVIGDPYLISTTVSSKEKRYSHDQNLFWIVEGYTSSVTYPYSSKLPNGSSIRYIRNSVKAVVDAYNGNIQLYIVESKDPIVQAWNKLFPRLFNPISIMPNEIKDHLRVPIDLFNIQVQQILRYHVTESRAFYNGDDVWQVPMELYGSTEVPVEPYHITAQLVDNNKSEFLLLQPLSPLARPNLAAWLAARNDGDNYGDLVLLQFPSETTIFGPEQIQALINQNPTISQQFSLWDRAGSEVIQGNLLVLPVGEALLYVEPVYLKASMGGLPTLTRVVVSDGKRIAMAETLAEGIKELLNQFVKEEKSK